MIGDILSRLEKVKRTGANNWLACCPAHDDKSPSFTIHAAEDGRIVCHCFGGCSFSEIVEAVGLSWEPWFPPKPIEHAPAIRRPYPAADVLEALAFETTLVSVTAQNIAAGVPLTDEDRKRLMVAHRRVTEAGRLALGR